MRNLAGEVAVPVVPPLKPVAVIYCGGELRLSLCRGALSSSLLAPLSRYPSYPASSLRRAARVLRVWLALRGVQGVAAEALPRAGAAAEGAGREGGGGAQGQGRGC